MHETVLLHEAVTALVTRPDGIYVDGTFGRGGHSREILAKISDGGRLLAIDKDPAAAEAARQLAADEPRLAFFHGSFIALPHQLHRMGIDKVDGILVDLGVSSPQLDQGDRGFSFSQDGPLDMRMDNSSGETAAQWLAVASKEDIASVWKEYGEERFSKRIAAAIVEAREEEAITTTARLASIVSAANPRWEKHKHPATRAFQALRIHVNRELGDLEDLLAASLDLLREGGRLVVISFHSLEDRIVKRFMRDMSRGKALPRGVPVMDEELERQLRTLGRAQRAEDVEVAANPRARSAIMRVAERLA